MLSLLVLTSALGSVATAAPAALDVWGFERERVLAAAQAYLNEPPLTITAAHSPRSAGGPHDYFSEADYWWPDPVAPAGPYIQRDGLSNPDNFDEHRRALRRLSVQFPALVAAWRLSGDARYAEHAGRHLRAWFLDEATCMNPNLRYAQAIHGRVSGRATGIIDTLHLVEVARAIEWLFESSKGGLRRLPLNPRSLRPSELGSARSPSPLSPLEQDAIRAWFAEYLEWMTTDAAGLEERDAKNNHASCWLLQVAAFARLAGRTDLLADGRQRFKTVLIPNQMAPDGSFPLELRRTKPYGYSLFNLEALAAASQLLSTPADDLWRFELPDGRGLRRAMAYMVPFIRDKKSWPLPPDVLYDREWPMRQSSLLFAGLAYREPAYLELWRRLPADSTVDEVIRNFFVRQPVLWVDAGAGR